MNVLFLQSLTYPFIGVMSISAVLRQSGHQTRLLFLDFNRPTAKDFQQIRDFAPGIVGIPVYTGWQRGILRFCRQLQDKLGVPVILGGPHPTYCPEILAADAVDYICVGEAEIAFPEMVNRLEHGRPVADIPGIWLKKNGAIIPNGASRLPHLPELPPMDIDLYCRASEAIRHHDNREFSLNRGCPFGCHYCNEPSLRALHGMKAVRSKTVDQALEEIHYVFDKYPFKSVFFTSDNFFLKKDFALQFLPRFKREIGVPFTCQMRVELIDAEVARILKESGCAMVGVGVESGSPRVRQELLGRNMSNETLIRGCRHLQQQGIRINTYNMIGIPGETFAEALETVKLNIEINPTACGCSFFQPYPGTKMTEKMLQEGLITQEIFDQLPTSFYKRSALIKQDERKWINLHRLFQLMVLHPRMVRFADSLCKIRIPGFYTPIFLMSFYRYVRFAYNLGRREALAKIFKSALEAQRA